MVAFWFAGAVQGAAAHRQRELLTTGANVLRGSGVTGHCPGQTGWDLAYGDKSEPAFPATQCRPT